MLFKWEEEEEGGRRKEEKKEGFFAMRRFIFGGEGNSCTRGGACFAVRAPCAAGGCRVV